MRFRSLPLEVFLLIGDNLDIKGLNALARTCSSLAGLLGSLLYQKATKSHNYQSYFLFAAIHGQSSAVSKFLKAGVSMSAFDESSFDPELSSGCETQDELERARSYVMLHTDHPFLAASFFGHIDVMRILLSEGKVDINFHGHVGRHESGCTALQIAIWRNHKYIVRLLFERGATIENIDSDAEESPIVQAAECGNKTALELIFNKLDIQGEDLEGREKEKFIEKIKLHCEKACKQACVEGQHHVVGILLRQGGFDANLCVDQRPLLWYAASNLQVRTVQLLVRRGARMENEGDCAIAGVMQCTRSCNVPEGGDRIVTGIVIYLLKRGCNVANGGIHACALWCMANSGYWANHPTGVRDGQLKAIRRLLLKNGYDPEKCQHGCWVKRSLEQKIWHDRVDWIMWAADKLSRSEESLNVF